MTSKIDLRKLPAVVYLPTRRLHKAYAAGSAVDGSLYGFYTLCNRRIEEIDDWREIDQKQPFRDEVLWPAGKPVRPVEHCKQCEHIIERDA
jgi:hypothetical protein